MPKNEKRQMSGAYLDIKIFPAKKAPRARGRKKNPTKEAQKWLNLKKSEEMLEWILNENFTKNDFWLTPTYSDAYKPETEAEAAKNVDNFVRRLKRIYKAQGKELKVVKHFEWSDKGRPHHHIVISGGVSPLEIMEKWGMGLCSIEPLQFTERGLKGLAKYMCKSLHSHCRWSCSRNCKKPPKPKERFITNKDFKNLWNGYDDRQLWEQRFKDYFFVEAEKQDNSEYFRDEQYIHVKMCRRDADLQFISDKQYTGGLPKKRRRCCGNTSKTAKK